MGCGWRRDWGSQTPERRSGEYAVDQLSVQIFEGPVLRLLHHSLKTPILPLFRHGLMARGVGGWEVMPRKRGLGKRGSDGG